MIHLQNSPEFHCYFFVRVNFLNVFNFSFFSSSMKVNNMAEIGEGKCRQSVAGGADITT